MNRHSHLCVCAVFSLLFSTISQSGFTQTETNPQPWSEYVEKIGPNTFSYLSYPKYYDNMERGLVPVNPNLMPSRNPAWDFEVIEGIWILRVKNDGTFQAEHEGDVFTYRFNSIGVGRGSGFRRSDLGEPNFANVSVVGNTIYWSEVFRDIDLKVYYIPDMLKVDVVVKKAFVADVREELNRGDLNPEEYLTVRFDIVSSLIRSLAWQNGQDKDVFAEELEIDKHPIEFYKNGNVVHTLRLAETYPVDVNGMKVHLEKPINGKAGIRSRQTWQLSRTGSGVAEISAYLGDLSKVEDYDIVIDPSKTFQNGDPNTTYMGGADTFMYLNQNIDPGLDFAQRTNRNYGAATELASWAYRRTTGPDWDWSETRPLFRFKSIGSATGVTQNAVVTEAKLTLSLESRDVVGSVPSVFRIEPFAIKRNANNYYWVAGSGNDATYAENWTTWSHIQYNSNRKWDTLWTAEPTATPNNGSGGAGLADRIGSAGIALNVNAIDTAGEQAIWDLNPSVVQQWVDESWQTSLQLNDGIVLEVVDRMTDYSNQVTYWWHSCDSTTWSYRPKLEVTYQTNDPNLSGLETFDFDGLANPMPDGPSAPVFFKGYWYAYFQSTYPTDTTYTRIARNFAVKISDSAGMAANIPTISSSLLRYSGTTPTPAATGTAYPVLSAPYNQFVKITPGPNDWYNRMCAISTNYVEYNGSPTPSPIRVHAFVHTEDTHDGNGDTYGTAYNNNAAHAGISRIGYIRTDDPSNFPTPINANVGSIGASPTPKSKGPVVESFMKEEDWVYPLGTPVNPTPTPTPTNGPTPEYPAQHPFLETSTGVRHPNLAERGNYFYLFYDRNLSPRYVDSRLQLTPVGVGTPSPTPHPQKEAVRKSLIQRYDGVYISGPSICVARALKSDVLAYNPVATPPYNVNPWKNFYNDGNIANDGFNMPTMGDNNWSSPVVIPEATGTDPQGHSIPAPYRETPSVSFNSYLNKYVMLCKGFIERGESDFKWNFYLHIAYNDSLTRWSYGLRIDPTSAFSSDLVTNAHIQYPYLINNDNTSNKGSFT